MANNYEYYRRLFTSEYRFSPKYMAWGRHLLTYKEDDIISADVGVQMTSRVYSTVNGVRYIHQDGIRNGLVGVILDRIDYGGDTQVQARNMRPVEEYADRLIDAFDVDTAVGPQLDILGDIVGVDRVLKFDPTDASPVMDDNTYRLCIKAGIIKNQWKGSAKDLVDAWFTLFPDTPVFEIQDNQDMTFNVVISGDFTTLEREIIANGYIIPKPEGVRLNTLTIVDLSGFPLFAYDYDTLYMSGYGSHWATNAQGG